MSDKYICPKCGSSKLVGFDDCSGAQCEDCNHFIPDNEIDNCIFVFVKKSELSRLAAEFARRDEIIKRLVEAGENLIQLANFGNKKAIEYIDVWSALMKELDND